MQGRADCGFEGVSEHLSVIRALYVSRAAGDLSPWSYWPSVFPPLCLSVCSPSACLSVRLSSICLLASSSVCVASVCISVRPSVRLYILHLPVGLCTPPSVCLSSICLSVCPPFCPSVCPPSVCLTVCLLVHYYIALPSLYPSMNAYKPTELNSVS